jgi:hypothetical protein
MFQSLVDLFPAESRGLVVVLLAPLSWIPDWTNAMLSFIVSQNAFVVALLTVTVMLPALLMVAAMWSTMVSLYTLPFRSHRGGFVTAMLYAWWDAGRVVWFYWSGMARLAVAVVGWVMGTIKFVLLTLRNALFGIVRSPFELLDWTSRRYFQPGVPWIAFLILLLWSSVEATVFTFTLQPTLNEVFGALTGYDPNPAIVAPLLWLFLVMLVAGSFACIQVLNEAIRSRKVGEIIQMVLVEGAVMFFEVIFLYRELIDAITPWIAQTSGVQLGLFATLALASFGWVGVRGMSWFLFGRYGTPALLGILGRHTISQDGPLSSVPAPVTGEMWRAPIDALKGDVAWFREEGKRLFELLTLPVLQVLAAALNFAVVVVQSRPAFALPFRTLEDVLITNPFAARPQLVTTPAQTSPETIATTSAAPERRGRASSNRHLTPSDPMPRAAL